MQQCKVWLIHKILNFDRPEILSKDRISLTRLLPLSTLNPGLQLVLKLCSVFHVALKIILLSSENYPQLLLYTVVYLARQFTDYDMVFIVGSVHQIEVQLVDRDCFLIIASTMSSHGN